jgi:hypothetical protein
MEQGARAAMHREGVPDERIRFEHYVDLKWLSASDLSVSFPTQNDSENLLDAWRDSSRGP